MTKLQRAVLQLSIDHWQDLYNRSVDGGKIELNDVSSDNCACCEVWNDRSWENPCTGCPIRDYTGEDLCLATPYYTARESIKEGIYVIRHTGEELNFLKKVLEENE